MKTLGEILSSSEEFLKKKEISRPRFVAQTLLASVLQMKRMDLYLSFDRPMEEEELSLLRPLLKRAAQSEPVEYIVQKIPFCGVDICVSPHVLIPRPETELLVHAVMKESLDGKEVWDVCTGSGCIGIALKKKFPLSSVSLIDISPEALEVAKKNAEANGVDVEFLFSDLFSALQGRKADVILCNPPYISLEDYQKLEPSVLNFEPRLALVGGEDGLLFYKRLSEELPFFLTHQAKIFLEIGDEQGDAIFSLFSAPCWVRKRVEKDWSGRERFFFLEFEGVVV